VVVGVMDAILGVPYGRTNPASIIIDIPGGATRPLEDSSLIILGAIWRIVDVLTDIGARQPDPQWFFHYTFPTQCDLIEGSGEITTSGLIWLTTQIYASGKEAKERLSLSGVPSCSFVMPDYLIPDLVGPGVVGPDNGEQGGGLEWTSPGPIDLGPLYRFPLNLPAE
jgi:hypothetical protein